MPTTIISSPFTRFGSATPEAGSVRQAFNAEGYGISTSLFAYRQGGGIVPATSGFNVIGAGTAGDPLRLSQFSGFSVPSPILDTFTLTASQFTVTPQKGEPYQVYGFVSPSYPWIMASSSGGGSLSDSTFAVTGTTILGLSVSIAFGFSFEFYIDGEYTNTGWTTMTIYHNYSGTTTTINRADMSFNNLSADTQWGSGSVGNPFSNVTAGQNTYLITIT